MMADVGILSFGAYVPRRRLQRSAIYAANAWFAPGLKGLAKGERAIGDWDEDSVTMAVEAARDTLTGIDRSTVGSLSLASTTLPFVDRLNSGIVKEALVLSDGVAAFDLTGSQRAGVSALRDAFEAASGRKAPHLCLAAEMRKTCPASDLELLSGDAAAGLLVGTGDVVAKFLGAYSLTTDFVDHYRSPGMDYDYVYEARWIREEGHVGLTSRALKEGLAALGVNPTEIDRLLVPISAKGVAATLAKKAGIPDSAVADTLQAQLGEAGSAHGLVMLVAALEAAKPGEKILLVGFGQGADLILLETTDALARLAPRRGVAGSLAGGVKDENYMRWLAHRGLVDLDKGMRAEQDQKQPSTTLWRHRKAVMGLVGGRCTKTGTVQFPKSDISVNPNDRTAHTQEDYPLAEIPARVLTVTADSLTYSPSPPLYYGMIDFEGGGRMTAEFADLTEEVEVGCEMRMVFRIKAVDDVRGFVKYFWKAAPVR
ncbi:3-hydroxy-3-methylglutaryl CoA synthase [Novosphingobium sp. CF614]|uniref:3-oxoacyl-[acyl-carrier-protein] synthase III C-terminal domain-containing protein n=1 Tax=Novosphingobium sp. CF614 TaxID=1884364 RepID=UPI0008E01E3A|nr:3-oxoacyl-[acyl-carrier-protein] synthase III C-terminal domain-containing protein [Novosphingobium sp. CF614]SFF96402.1 3-hydroxy-3-methylglutaryl CoA synthase [Novosphingobium sp. CF614]